MEGILIGRLPEGHCKQGGKGEGLGARWGVAVAAAGDHPLTPFVVCDDQSDDDEETDDGEEDFQGSSQFIVRSSQFSVQSSQFAVRSS